VVDKKFDDLKDQSVVSPVVGSGNSKIFQFGSVTNMASRKLSKTKESQSQDDQLKVPEKSKEVKSSQNVAKSQAHPNTRSQTSPVRKHSNVEIKGSTRKEVPFASGTNENATGSSTTTVQKRGTIYTDPEPLPLPLRNREPRRKRKVSEDIGFDGQPARERHRHSWQSRREKEYRAYELGINPEDLDDSS